jgi:outer membrane receptor protein involved in Fe transport
MRLAPLLLTTTAVVTLAAVAPAFAQSDAKAKPATKEPETAVADVAVTAGRQAVTTSIDRKSYSVARDLQSTSGSVADVLRNLPSVDVDVDGNVSLRGQSVEILIDGKPSAMFKGQLRNTTLQQLPANTLETIEVMTNPSAEFRPDGSGGIINLVTKKPVKIGKTGSVQGAIGSYGRGQVGATGAVNKGKATWTANLGARVIPQRQTMQGQETRLNPVSGLRTDSVSASAQEVEVRNANATVALDYELSARDRVNLSATLVEGDGELAHAVNTGVRRDGAGTVIEDLTLRPSGDVDFNTTQLSALWRHTFAEPGRLLTVNGRYSEAGSKSGIRLPFDYAAGPADRDELRLQDLETSELDLSVNYTLPLPGSAVFKAGYEFQRAGVVYDTFSSSTDPVTGVTTPQPNITNVFATAQNNHQAFVTYQRPFGKLSVLGGLRLEEAGLDYDQRTTAIVGEDSYFEVHPSLHLQYAATDTQKLTLSYSHRIQRPDYSQLNPFVAYYDDYNASSGNPLLRPTETHSFEAGWQWVAPKATLGATAFYRQNYNTIGPVSRYLTPTVLLQTFENQGTSTSAGVDLSATGRLWTKVNYNLGATVFRNEIERSSLAGGGTKSAVSYTAKGNVDYRATDKDLLQVRLNYSGKALNSQGYRKPFGSVDLGYQRKIRPDLIITATANDIFESVKFTTVTDTPSLQAVSTSFPIGRTFSLGISKQFGGRPVREGQFDYSTPTEAGSGTPGGF